mmetsp:Transcript_81293/g.161364  ORF Transcript_81293/g.161364 Transcript_81293/m.161364 type:complete len:368 (-) Transcript_81293:87-1190(-)
MSSALRRRVIQHCMTQYQRLAVETHVRSCGNGQQSDNAAKSYSCTRVVKRPLEALGNASSSFSQDAYWESRRVRGSGGIYKSGIGDKVYGYYAKAGHKNLIFCTRIQRELQDAVRDHILLAKILEHIRSENEDQDLPQKVKCAITLVLDGEGLAEQAFFRSVTVGISAHHWIGRVLWVHCLQLDRALDAWSRHNNARGCPLFHGNLATAEYTPRRAQEQWSCVREVFVQLQTERGRLLRSQVEAQLNRMEMAYRKTFVRKAAHFQKLQYQQTRTRARTATAKVARDKSEVLLRRFERAILNWSRAVNHDGRRRKRAEAEKLKLDKKLRWDGKESIADFQRKVREETGSNQFSNAWTNCTEAGNCVQS